MSVITAPAAPPSNFYAAKSVRGDNGVQVDIFGYQIPNSLNIDGLTPPFTFINNTTLFDVSGLTSNHEVIVVGYISPNQIASATNYTVRWYRKRDNQLVFIKTESLSDPPEGYVWDVGSSFAFWIGWLDENLTGVPTYPQYREIQENGDYYATITATGGGNFSTTINFAVKGMPVYTVVRNVGSNQFDWVINLSEYFDIESYIRVGVCSEPFTSGQSEEPSSILDYVNAPSINTGAATSGTVYQSVSTVYGFAQTADGIYWSTGSADTHMLTRPYNWAWYSSIVQNGAFNMSALEWNDFCSRINEFLTYKGLATYSFTQAVSGQNFYAYMFNQARNKIAQMVSVSVPVVLSGDNIYASYLNGLVSALNSIT